METDTSQQRFSPEYSAGPLDFGTHGVLVTRAGAPRPDPAARHLLAELAPDLQLQPVSREAFLAGAPALSLQALVVGASALGRCSLDMLDAIQQRLRPGGLCLVFGRMTDAEALGPEHSEISEQCDAPVWRYLQAQAQRCGLALLREQPPASASPRMALFRKTAAHQRLRIATMHSADAPALQALFANVFSPQRMSAEHWQWKYGSGRGVGVGVWSGGELVAHYGGVWRTAWRQGEPVPTVQITDVMVSPRERGVLSRDGAFARAAASFPECFTGYGAKALLGFGFPNERHFRAAALRRLYAEVDRMCEISWPPAASARQRPLWGATTRLQMLTPHQLGRSPRKLERLWTAMQRSLRTSLVGVRDWPYLRHRYLRNPLHQYRFFLLRQRLTGRWLAVAVVTVDHGAVHLRDLIGDRQCFPLLIERLRQTPLCSQRPLRAWISASHAQHLETGPANSRDLGIVVPHSIWTAGPGADTVSNRWWLMSGDTDFL